MGAYSKQQAGTDDESGYLVTGLLYTGGLQRQET